MFQRCLSIAILAFICSSASAQRFALFDADVPIFEVTPSTGTVQLREPENDGNPEYTLGASDAEELHIQAVFDAGGQTLDYVLFQTDVASATDNKGLYRFNVDGTNIFDIQDDGIVVGDGTGSPRIYLNKSETGTTRFVFQKLGVEFGRLDLNSGENFIFRSTNDIQWYPGGALHLSMSPTGATQFGFYTWNFGTAQSFEITNSTGPTLDTDGQIAVDTLVTDWSHGILEYYSGEALGVVAMPIAQFTTPTDGYVVSYNATNDEFELVAQSGGADDLGNHTATQDLNMAGFNIDSADSIYLDEKAAADADIAADGQLWVKSDTPNTLWFTDDAGTDFQIATLTIDIGDDTNLIGGTNITLTGDTLDVDDAFLLNTGDAGTGVYDFGGATSFEVPNGADPTTDAFGEIAADNDAWAASRGALEHFDGTASTFVVAALASDVPSDGQVPTWNTGGTITWETAGGGGTSGNNNEVLTDDGAGGIVSESNMTFTGSLLTVAGSVEINPATTTQTGLILQTTDDNGTNNLLEIQDSTGTAYMSIAGDTPYILEWFNTGQSIFLGEDAGASDDLTSNTNTYIGYQAGTANVTGINNLALGKSALAASTSPDYTVAIGSSAMQTAGSSVFGVVSIGFSAGLAINTSYSTAIGYNALKTGTTGSYRCVAIGANAGRLATGNNNIYIGDQAGETNTGSQNVMIGSKAGDVSAATSGCICLGYLAGSQNTTSDRLYIDDSNTTTPLIYGEFDNDVVLFNAKTGSPDTTLTLGAAATAIAITRDMHHVVGDGGGNTVATITGGVDGQIVVFIFDDANITITDTDAHTANTIDLAGTATNLSSADDLTLTLAFDGTSYYELSRSTN